MVISLTFCGIMINYLRSAFFQQNINIRELSCMENYLLRAISGSF